MKRLIIVLVLVAGLMLTGTQMSFGQLSGPLSGTLGPGLYHVVDSIYVVADDTLRLLPGTTLVFDGPYPLTIFGILDALATEADSIRFTTDTLANPAGWRGLIFSGAQSSESCLKFCVIENARVDEDGGESQWRNGVGILCQGSSPLLSRLAIRRNIGRWHPVMGGGVYGGTLDSCLITENYAAYDGGGACFCTLTNCILQGNSATLGGGAGFSTLTDCQVVGNTAGEGGGLMDGTAIRCSIVQNSADIDGGGCAAMSLSDCILQGNHAGQHGGGIESWGGGSITNCLFVDNEAPTGGALWTDYGGTAVTNCTFVGNSSGLSSWGALFVIKSSVIAFCSGVAIDFQYGNPNSIVENCDFFGNAGGDFAGQWPAEFGNLIMTNGNGDSCDAYQNIFLDPQFADMTGGDYYLASVSHCIGAANPTDPPPTDIDGNPRPNPPGSNPDIGAYENALGVPESPDECESSPDTIWFVGPATRDQVSHCVHMCFGHEYIAVFPWCPDVNPEVPNDIEVVAGCWECGDQPEYCTLAAGWIVTPWVMEQPYDWISHIYLTDQGVEGCACLSVQLWLEMRWNEDCWLPVELASFDAVPEGDAIRIRFSTASEQDNDYFDIMRGTSAEGSFSTITRIPSQGQSATEQHYSYLDRDVDPGHTYWYYLVDVDFSGQRTEHRDRLVSTSVPLSGELPLEYALAQNYPNPFNASTEISYAIPEAGHVTLTLYDAMGRSVAVMVDAERAAGWHKTAFDGGSLPSGIYFYHIEVNGYSAAQKMMLIR